MTQGQKFLQARDFLLNHRTDYETAYHKYKLPEFTKFNWALDYFDVQAKENHDTAIWLIDENGLETKLSFLELSTRSNQVANFLKSYDLTRGDRVLVMFNNQVEIWETMLAAMKIGLVIIPSSPFLTREDLDDRITRGRVKLVITNYLESGKFDEIDGDFIKISVGGAHRGWIRYEDAFNESEFLTTVDSTNASDPLLLYFTSGTTSKPKLVLHSHISYPVGHLATMYWLGLQPGDIHFNISSPGWAKHAWSSFFAPWNAGATIFVYNYSRFDAREVLDVINRCKVSSLCAPPTVWRMLVQEDLREYPVSLREIVSAGEPLNAEIIEEVRLAWNITIRDGYGQTETTAQIGNSPGQTVKSGSMGKPLPGYKVVLLNTEDASANDGEISLDLNENPVGLMLGYEDNPQKTAEVMRNGFYHTGDMAFRDADGYLTFVGRNDDIFKSSDYRISPFELESVLIEHEAVAEAAVVPSPDPVRLSLPKAFVSLSKGYSADSETALSIFKHCRLKLAPYKRIRRLEFAELPKTSSGKIRRVELRSAEEIRELKVRHAQEFWEEDFLEHFLEQ